MFDGFWATRGCCVFVDACGCLPDVFVYVRLFGLFRIVCMFIAGCVVSGFELFSLLILVSGFLLVWCVCDCLVAASACLSYDCPLVDLLYLWLFS